jgi:hypothetical protein
VLDAKVIHAEEQSRHEAGNNPIHSKSKTGEPLWPARRADGSKSARAAYQFRPRLPANSLTGLIHLQFKADLLSQ